VLTPKRVGRLKSYKAADAAAGGAHSLVLLEDGSVWSFGDNGVGQLCRRGALLPALVTSLGKGMASIAAGAAHSVAVKDGTVWAAGRNMDGQLGNGTLTNSRGFIKIVALKSSNPAFAPGLSTRRRR